MHAFALRADQSYPCVPPMVAAAQDYIRFAEQLRNPSAGFDGGRSEARDLGSSEQQVYDAALDVLLKYFSNSLPTSMVVIPGPGLDDEGPTNRVRVTS